jgi:hypothetical protein
MTPAATKISRARVLAADEQTFYRVLGLSIAALIPALFWTGVLALVGTAVGTPLSAQALAITGTAIAGVILAATYALFLKIS